MNIPKREDMQIILWAHFHTNVLIVARLLSKGKWSDDDDDLTIVSS